MKRFVKIDECNDGEEFGFMDTVLGTRYHLTEKEYKSLLDIIFEHEAGKVSFKPIIHEPAELSKVVDAILERGRYVLGDEEYDLDEGQY